MREEIIPIENFRVGVKADTWQDAVRAAGQVLIDRGSIKKDYVDEMIQAVYDLGPYMVLMPNFALAPAAPGPSVLKDDMSLILLEKPVEFHCENDPVSVILCVACVNRDSHREALTRVADALMDDAIYDRLAGAKDVEEAYRILHGEE